jgi:hypothetical protein
MPEVRSCTPKTPKTGGRRYTKQCVRDLQTPCHRGKKKKETKNARRSEPDVLTIAGKLLLGCTFRVTAYIKLHHVIRHPTHCGEEPRHKSHRNSNQETRTVLLSSALGIHEASHCYLDWLTVSLTGKHRYLRENDIGTGCKSLGILVRFCCKRKESQ